MIVSLTNCWALKDRVRGVLASRDLGGIPCRTLRRPHSPLHAASISKFGARILSLEDGGARKDGCNTSPLGRQSVPIDRHTGFAGPIVAQLHPSRRQRGTDTRRQLVARHSKARSKLTDAQR